MEKENKIVQSLWIGNELSKLERLSIKSFLFNGHEYHLYLYKDINDLPDGIIIKDANEIIPEKDMFSKKINDNSPKGIHVLSDVFRHKLLYDHGGWWVDLDVVCLQPFDFAEQYVIGSAKSPVTDEQKVNSCVLKMPKKSLELKYCLEEYAKHKNGDNIEYGGLGPKLLHEIVKKFKKNEYVKSWKTFCPINWWEVDKIVRPNYDFQITLDMYSIHLYNVKWEEKGYDKNMKYDEISIFEQLKKFYGIL